MDLILADVVRLCALPSEISPSRIVEAMVDELLHFLS